MVKCDRGGTIIPNGKLAKNNSGWFRRYVIRADRWRGMPYDTERTAVNIVLGGKDMAAKNISNMVCKQKRPVKVMQFGEGNFLRGFADEMIDVSNEKGITDMSIVIVKPRKGTLKEAFRQQDCDYTVSLRGLMNNEPTKRERIITSVTETISCYDDYDKYMEYAVSDDLRFVISNTTEAGIVYDGTDTPDMKPQKSFPGKVTALLYARYKHFEGDRSKGLIFLPVELIDNNADVLKEIVLRHAAEWKLRDGFITWIKEACVFSNTLVDRIISGYSADDEEELYKRKGYEDKLLVAGELFGLWVIAQDERITAELPLDKAEQPVLFVQDIKPYKTRKVRILNGAHTSFVLWAYLKGHDYVLEAMDDEEIREFVEGMLRDEVIDTIDLDKDELNKFADDVITRFRNPFIKHALSSIALNSVSKWKTRCLPTLLDYFKMKGKLPDRLTKSLAALLLYYRGSVNAEGDYVGTRIKDGKACEYKINDDPTIIDFLKDCSGLSDDEYIDRMLDAEKFFGMKLSDIEGLADKVKADYAVLAGLRN